MYNKSKLVITVFILMSTLTLINDVAYGHYDDYNLWISPVTYVQPSSAMFIGSRPGSLTTYDIYDRIIPEDHNYFLLIGSHHVNGIDGWDGPSGFFDVDRRSALGSEIGSFEKWRMYIWATPEMPEEHTKMWLYINYADLWDENLSVTLELIKKPEGVLDGPGIGTLWYLNPPREIIYDFPIYRTDNGLEGYVFDLTVTVVPEPASLIVLSAGLAGFAGAVRRRRRN